MNDKSQNKKDNEAQKAMDLAAEQVARLLWKHWLWLQKMKKNNSKRTDS